MVAGTAEIAAGLCLLLPRGGILGAVLLTCVMVGTMGASLGHVIATRGADPLIAMQTYRTAAQADAMVKPIMFKKSQGWDI